MADNTWKHYHSRMVGKRGRYEAMRDTMIRSGFESLEQDGCTMFRRPIVGIDPAVPGADKTVFIIYDDEVPDLARFECYMRWRRFKAWLRCPWIIPPKYPPTPGVSIYLPSSNGNG